MAYRFGEVPLRIANRHDAGNWTRGAGVCGSPARPVASGGPGAGIVDFVHDAVDGTAPGAFWRPGRGTLRFCRTGLAGAGASVPPRCRALVPGAGAPLPPPRRLRAARP